MTWVVLLCAAALEVVWALALKQSDGFSRLVPGTGGMALLDEDASPERFAAIALGAAGVAALVLTE